MTDDRDESVAGHIGLPSLPEVVPTPILHLFAGRGATPPENVRPCPHLPRHHVTLDEEFATVTCSGCGERLDAFAVLLIYARDFERHKTMRWMVQDAHRKLSLASLRRVRALRGLLAEEVERIDTAIHRASYVWHEGTDGQTPESLGKVASDVERALRSRKRTATP